MPAEAPRQRKLLRLAWALPVALLLCGLQLGWLDTLWLDSAAPGLVNEPAPLLLASLGRRRDLTAGDRRGGIESAGSNAGGGGSDDDDEAADEPRRCDGPFDIPKVWAS